MERRNTDPRSMTHMRYTPFFSPNRKGQTRYRFIPLQLRLMLNREVKFTYDIEQMRRRR